MSFSFGNTNTSNNNSGNSGFNFGSSATGANNTAANASSTNNTTGGAGGGFNFGGGNNNQAAASSSNTGGGFSFGNSGSSGSTNASNTGASSTTTAGGGFSFGGATVGNNATSNNNTTTNASGANAANTTNTSSTAGGFSFGGTGNTSSSGAAAATTTANTSGSTGTSGAGFSFGNTQASSSTNNANNTNTTTNPGQSTNNNNKTDAPTKTPISFPALDAPSSSLTNLLEQSKQLSALQSTSSTATLPKSLTSLYSQSKKLSTTFAQNDGTKAAYLLGRNGFDVKNYKNLLRRLKLKRSAFEAQEPLFVTDLHGYLLHEHHMMILTSIEEAKKQTQNMFYEKHNQCVDNDWRRAKAQFMNLLGSRKGTAAMEDEPINVTQQNVSSLSQQQPVLGTRGKTRMTSKMQVYANAVLKLNKDNSSETHYPIIQEMRKCAENVDESPGRRQEIIQHWELLRILLSEEEAVHRAVTRPYEAYSSPQTAAGKEGSPKSIEKKFINGARRYLESRYLSHMKEMCMRHAQDLNLPQNAPPQTLIESYVKQRYQMSSTGEWRIPGVTDVRQPHQARTPSIQLSNGRPMWALIFYALRCGQKDVAIQFTKDQSFSTEQDVQIVQKLLTGDYSAENEGMRSQIAQKFRTTDYVFKKAVLLVLGKKPHEDALMQSVFSKVEDYIWQKLMLIPEGDIDEDTSSSDYYSLAQLQELIVNLGPHYFNVQKHRSSLLYFKLLLLIQEFERAIAYLFERDVDGFRTEAVHFAIVLDYYGVLVENKDIDAPLLAVPGSPHYHARDGSGRNTTKRAKPQINYSFILKDYVRLFAHTDPREAVSYLCRISNSHHRMKYLKDVVIESQDTSAILGSISDSGIRNKGIIEKMLSRNEFRDILDMAADEYQRTGRHEAAIDLHFLAADVKHASADAIRHLKQSLQIISRDLSRVLALDTAEKSDVIELAQRVFSRTAGKDELHHGRHALEILLRLDSFFEDARCNNFESALEKIKQLRLLPLDNVSIEDAYQHFSSLDDTVKQNVSEAIVETMRCLQGLAKTRKDYRSQMMIRSNTSELLEFARRVDEHTSGRIYERVIRFDFYLNQ